MIKILIADDHSIVRAGLKQILAGTPDMIVSGEAATAEEVLNKISKDDYDVVVLDIGMPGKSGLDTLKELKCERPKLPVLILSMYPEEQYAVRVLRAGASGYMTKESAPDDLVGAIRRVAHGKKYISPFLADRLATSLAIDTDKPLHESLSDREYQVMCLIASGKTVSDIAAKLSLSVKTISTYRTRILEKMGKKNNAELTHYAIQNRLIE
ncbi:MAG TPA: DNA-binding response regulator [Nitrospiraceae bacterium]|jgi:DNA-binding NarL/FixJ family response regulator|nr:DNA-binding response regulator [Nitrospiraceae bacterium]